MSSASSLTASLQRLLRDRSANVATLAAVFAPIATLMAAMAIDTGAISTQKRSLQGYADMAAIAAASNLNNAEGAALQVLSDNGFHQLAADDRETDAVRSTSNRFQIETGHYRADGETAFDERFVPDATPVNAVRVSLREPQQRYFEFLGPSKRDLSARGTAVASSQAAISVGSRLVRLDGGLLNELLSGLTGSQISLSAMSYDALLDADVDLFASLDALATRLDLTAVTYDDLLQYDVTLADLVSGMAEAVDGRVNAVNALDRLSRNGALSEISVRLGELFELGPAGRSILGMGRPGADLMIDALQMLTMSAVAANGANQIDLDLDASLGALGGVNISLLVGERPQQSTWFALSDANGQPVSTAQLRLFIELQLIGGGRASGSLLRLPIYMDLASAEARITDIVCKPGQAEAERVSVSVHPGLMTLRIADLNGGLGTMSQTPRFEAANLLNARLLQVKAYSETRLSAPDADKIWFSQHDIGGDPKTVATHSALRGALSSAIGSLDLDVQIIGLSLLSPRLLQADLADTLSTAAAPVDEIVMNLTKALGLGLGEADVWLHDAGCNQSVLVQ